MKPLRPRARFAIDEASQVRFYTLVNHFGLANRLWVIVENPSVIQVVLRCNEVPCSQNNSFQNELRKILSLSETIEEGSPWSQQLLWRKEIAGAENGCLRHKKWPYSVSLSTTTRMVSKPLDLGNPSTKSRLMSSHTWLGWVMAVANLQGRMLILLTCLTSIDIPSNISPYTGPKPLTS